MTYENPDIQKAIDQVFVSQQLKDVAQAKYDAQVKDNLTITLAATAQKQAEITRQEGVAAGNKLVSDSLKEAQQNPLFVQVRTLEVQAKQVEKWDGQFPTYYMGSNPASLLSIPLPAVAK